MKTSEPRPSSNTESHGLVSPEYTTLLPLLLGPRTCSGVTTLPSTSTLLPFWSSPHSRPRGTPNSSALSTLNSPGLSSSTRAYAKLGTTCLEETANTLKPSPRCTGVGDGVSPSSTTLSSNLG